MAMIKELNAIKPVWIELGLQTIHESTAKRINRQYSLSVFESAYQRLKLAGITVIVHVIFGLPGETEEDMLETIRYLAQLDPALDGIKFHMLNVLKNTALASEYEQHPFLILTMEEYVSLVTRSIEILPDNIVVHRMTGDGEGSQIIEPQWVKNKKMVLNFLNKLISQQ